MVHRRRIEHCDGDHSGANSTPPGPAFGENRSRRRRQTARSFSKMLARGRVRRCNWFGGQLRLKMMDDVEALLRPLSLGQYAETFRNHGVDAARLPDLTVADLRAMGIDLMSHRRRILAAVHHLKTGRAPPRPLPADELPP